MASGLGQIVRITIFGFSGAEPFQNVFHYEQTDAPEATYLEWASEFWNTIKAAWRAYMPNDAITVTNTVRIEEIGGALQFGDYTIPTLERVGLRSVSSARLPTGNATGIKLVPETRITRPGQKRLVGLHEEDSNGVGLEAAVLALAVTLAATFTAELAYGALELSHARPVIYGPVLEPTEHNPAGRPVAVVNPVVGSQVNKNVTSQISRKAKAIY